MSNGDGDPIGGTAATAILAGAALTLVGSLIVGITLDFGSGDSGSEALRYRLKIIALSSSSLAFFGSAIAGAFIVGVALLVALALANGASPATAKSVRSGVTVLAGLLALLTVAAVVIDLTLLSEEGVHAGNVAGIVVADLASLVVVSAAAWAGAKATRAAT